jgi:hypothetical protein
MIGSHPNDVAVSLMESAVLSWGVALVDERELVQSREACEKRCRDMTESIEEAGLYIPDGDEKKKANAQYRPGQLAKQLNHDHFG